ncbi:MAG: hypothetical protein QNL77_10355 [Akkermansiaceae bacterium]
MPEKPTSIASQWFHAAEAAGDFMGIRYGRIARDSTEVDWSFVSHCDCDGIGGFARLLRNTGADLPSLPKTKNPNTGTFLPLWRMWRESRKQDLASTRPDWTLSSNSQKGPSKALAWHLFTEAETENIRQASRSQNVTVNSLLLKHLDKAIRPDLRNSNASIPWMIPVNLRGQVQHSDDTENHVSWVEPKISPHDSPADIHHQVRHRLNRGEHRANYLTLGLGKFLSHRAKIKLITKDRTKPTRNIGAFSNLGVWDSEKSIDTTDSWLFCPPVAGGQLLGAGCVTFQNCLSLTIQAHPSLNNQPEIAQTWMTRWSQAIRRADVPSASTTKV